MAEDSRPGVKEEDLESEVREMQLKEEMHDHGMDMDIIKVEQYPRHGRSPSASVGEDQSGASSPSARRKQSSRSPDEVDLKVQFSAATTDFVDTIGGDVTLKLEPGLPPKLQRTTSRKIERRPPPLFSDYADATSEATSTFSILRDCTYANKYLGTTEHALECDCAEEWDSATATNWACGEDSDCINRATKMECIGDCGCGTACQNQRFHRKEYADVSVIKTEKKGYGLRANTNLKPNDFIFEYIGEVIGENAFRKRMQQYDEEGIKHFYFMSLTKGEFVDATRKGNLGRFCNHSCNPNCYVDKWVIGDKLRMGIFAERKIQAGEELVFNYNVDRYGAEPQPCYCGEPNCTGYIGGKTQTERATKLSNAIIEALGIDDADAWDTAVAKRPRKKKTGEDDEEYVNNVEPRGLDEDGVNKVMSSLMQCKEKWIAVKLLTRIQRADDEKVRNRVVRFHGYRILKTVLANFIDDTNVCLQVLDVLDNMPRLTRNKIQDSKIEETVQQLIDNEDERVARQAKGLLESWGKLEVGYRIPRMKRDPNAVLPDRKLDRVERRETDRRRSRSRTPDRPQAPTGPRSNVGPRPSPFFNNPRPPPRMRPPPPNGPLPVGWFEATAANGSVYYYNSAGTTTWQRPTGPATGAPPPPPPKAVTDQQLLQDLIKNIVSTKKEPGKPSSNGATPADTPRKERREAKWRSLPEEKQKKVYESTLQPHIMHVVGKYKHKLAKDDLKRWAKEFAKKMVDSDFRKGRVEDPSRVSDKQAKSIKKHAQEFFDKAVKKKDEAEARRAERKAKTTEDTTRTPTGSPSAAPETPLDKVDDDVVLTDDEVDGPDGTPTDPADTSAALKRERGDSEASVHEDNTPLKKQRTASQETAPPPPPPPPPPPVELLEGALYEATASDRPESSSSFPLDMMDAALPGAPATDATVHALRPVTELYTASTSAPKQPSELSYEQQKAELTQTATPPTTGSPDYDAEESEKVEKTKRFAGLESDCIRQLDILDGGDA